MLPGGWSGVTQDASDCATIAPSGTCTLSFTSTTPYVAQGNITISGDNVTSPPTTALAFSLDDYLVYAVSGVSPSGEASVVANTDAAATQWSATLDNITGIDETSTAPCAGATDGRCDSDQIAALYAQPYSAYAAGLCFEIASDNTGGVSLNTWYLPAICELASAGGGASCPVGIANIDSNLVQLGFTNLASYYWSSTEYSGIPNDAAWIEFYTPGSSGQQLGAGKADVLAVRCVRQISY
jgi:hypothetical protein